MTTATQLEYKGTLLRNPVAEVLAELNQKKLSGALRLAQAKNKIIVYFESGDVVFAVSNARRHRLFDILLEQNLIDKPNLTKIDDFTNDLHLATTLIESGDFTKKAIYASFVFQITSILKDAVAWEDGEFIFNASARVKSDIHFPIVLNEVFETYVNNLTVTNMLARISNMDERFSLRAGVDLSSTEQSPEAAFVLSRLGREPVSVETLRAMSGFEFDVLVPILYSNWMSGLVVREDWSSAIDAEDTERLSAVKFELKRSALSYEVEKAKEAVLEAKALETLEAEREANAKSKETNKETTLEEYLENMENAATHYEVFDISPDAKIHDIKKKYFSFAKQFHPDLFYRQVDAVTHKRIQTAFTEIAQAYETLKNPETREVYDFKLRKVIEQLREAQSGAASGLTKEDLEMTGHKDMAADNFDTGYDYLLKDKIETAIPYLARAVHLDSSNARYHAFFGRALTFDPDNQRKAEHELQAAIKLEPGNTQYKIMLAELFVEIGHTVRARGELERLLKTNPNLKEAQALLDSLE